MATYLLVLPLFLLVTGDLAKSGAYELASRKRGLRLKRLIKQVLSPFSLFLA
ncbi:hypothetical protein O9929_04435 [Vibrio lentus]|nr:hypothetical protein [Vibrio lentus]